MRVIVTSFGSSGDFNPLLAIAAALVRRGAAVTFVANPFYERQVESTGSRFVAAGAYFDVFAALADNPRYFEARTGAVAIWNELVAPSIREIYPVVCDVVRSVGATAVVSHLLSYGGAWAAAKTGVGSVVVNTSAAAWLSRHEPVVFANWRAPRVLQGWITVAMRGVGRLVLDRVLRRLASELGAPPITDIARHANLNLGVWPEWFRRAVPDDPPRAQLCGFVFDAVDVLRPLSAELQRFLDEDEAPVVAAFGSAASLHAADRYRAIASACAELGRRCVLIGASALGVAAGTRLAAVARAPYAAVFPRAAAIVHHGGFGTCAEALRAGKPSLVTPFAYDQFDTAARVDAAGTGRWLRDGRRIDLVAAALDDVLRNSRFAAASRAAAAKIAAATPGADRAAELIEGIRTGSAPAAHIAR